jgi:hypothetical protein
MTTDRKPMKQHVLPCSCIVTEYPGNVRTMMCQEHLRAHAARVSLPMSKRGDVPLNNLDLIGG